MDSMYGGFLPGVEMSDTPPSGVPDESQLVSQALIHGEEHLMHEQPDGNPKDEYFSQEFANGIPDQSQDALPTLEEQGSQQEAEDADFWFVDNNLPPQQQAQLLNDKLMQVRDFLESEQYQQEIEQYRQQRINEIEQELPDFAVAYRALQQNPKDFLAKYLPEALLQYGVSPVMSQAEIGTRVQDQLKQMYGDDYQQRVDTAEMFTPGSYTSMVYQSQQQLFQQYTDLNNQNEQLVKNWGELVASGQINTNPETQIQAQDFGGLPVETQAEQLVQEYEKNWKEQGYTEDEFVEFVERAKTSQMSMQEVHKVVYFENYMTEAYKQGIKQGQEMMYSRIRNTGNGSTVQRPPQQQEYKGLPFEEQERSDLFKRLAEGGIPIW